MGHYLAYVCNDPFDKETGVSRLMGEERCDDEYVQRSSCPYWICSYSTVHETWFFPNGAQTSGSPTPDFHMVQTDTTVDIFRDDKGQH